MSDSFSLYLFRHAQSANNAVADSERVEDPGLTEIGFDQAERLAGRFQSVHAQQPISHLLTSGFLRAVQTMRPVAEVCELRPAIWTDLHEVGGCFSGWERGNVVGRPGMDRETLGRDFPEFDLPDDIDEAGWWKSKPFEEYSQAQARAQRQAQRLLDEFRGTTSRVACVIHADFKALLLEALLSGDYDAYAAADLLNTGVTLLECRGDDVRAVAVNDADHLPTELKTS